MKRRVTLKEVAEQASVSYQTVSKVINQKVRISPEAEQRIWKAVKDLDYTPSYTARSLRSQRSQTIGYTWQPSPPDQANPILDLFLQSMFSSAEQKGYYLLCFPHRNQKKILDAYRLLIDSGRVDAFVLSSVENDDPCIQFLCDQNFPFVAFGRQDGDLHFPYIDVDGGLGIKMAVNHLLSLSHRKIAILAWPLNSRVGDNRIEGYFSAMNSAGIEIHPEWVQRGEGTYKIGYSATMKLLSLRENIRPTGIIAMNDLMAIGAMAAIRHSGLLPGKDIAVTGFDDTPTARYLRPPLTSLRQPIWDIGQNLMDRLIEFLESGTYPLPFEELVAPQLIIRESSTGLPAQGELL